MHMANLIIGMGKEKWKGKVCLVLLEVNYITLFLFWHMQKAYGHIDPILVGLNNWCGGVGEPFKFTFPSVFFLSKFCFFSKFHALYRDEALSAAEQQIKSIELKLNSALSSHQSEKETWELNLQNVEETWRCMFLIL